MARYEHPPAGQRDPPCTIISYDHYNIMPKSVIIIIIVDAIITGLTTLKLSVARKSSSGGMD